MKEFFSKTLNIVTVCCLIIWFAMIAIAAFAFPEMLDRTYAMSEKLIDLVIGSLIGAGGVKVKQMLDQAKTGGSETYDNEPVSNDFE